MIRFSFSNSVAIVFQDFTYIIDIISNLIFDFFPIRYKAFCESFYNF